MTDLLEDEKKIAGREAVNFVRNGMVLGLGTGTTVRYFLEALSARVKDGIDIIGVPTSKKTEEMAKILGIKIGHNVDHIDLDIDGADEIDRAGRMIKGGGGALFRERIVASHSREILIICDHSKYVEKIGKFPVPVEISPFMESLTIKKLGDICSKISLRQNGYFFTDEGNHIVDCSFESLEDPEQTYNALKSLPGVIDVGIFLKMEPTLIVAAGNKAKKLKFGNKTTSGMI